MSQVPTPDAVTGPDGVGTGRYRSWIGAWLPPCRERRSTLDTHARDAAGGQGRRRSQERLRLRSIGRRLRSIARRAP